MTAFQTDLLASIAKGVRETEGLIGAMTDYHGGPLKTEYMLTTDIARALVNDMHQVSVERLNRQLLGFGGGFGRHNLGSKRTDIAVLDGINPKALIEIKTRVARLRAIKVDLKKITDTLGHMDPRLVVGVIGLSVFQVFVSGTDRRSREVDISNRLSRIVETIRGELDLYAKAHPTYSFQLEPLGIASLVPQNLEEVGGEWAWGQHGHAVSYQVVIIRSKVPAPITPSTFAGMKAQSKARGQ